MSDLKRLFCKHDWQWCRNIYGDEINHAGGRRSVWRCPKCGARQLRDQLYKGPGSEYDKIREGGQTSDLKDWLARDVLIVGKLEAADEIYVPGCGYYAPEPGAHIVICESAEPLHEVQGEELTAPVPFEDAPEFERMSYEELEAWAMHVWYDEAYMRDENRRLRELVRELYACSRQYGCDRCEYRDGCAMFDRMAQLGIEVDG